MVGSAELEPKSEPPFLPASARKGGSGSTTRYLWSSYFEWKFLLGDALDEVETLNLEKKAFAQLRKNITRHILVEGGHSSTSILLLKQQSTQCSLLFYIQF